MLIVRAPTWHFPSLNVKLALGSSITSSAGLLGYFTKLYLSAMERTASTGVKAIGRFPQKRMAPMLTACSTLSRVILSLCLPLDWTVLPQWHRKDPPIRADVPAAVCTSEGLSLLLGPELEIGR